MPGNGKGFANITRRTRIVIIAAGAALLVLIAALAFSLAFVFPQSNAARSTGSGQPGAATTPAKASTPISSATPSTAAAATRTPSATPAQPQSTPLPITPFLDYTLTKPLPAGWSLTASAPQSDPFAQSDTYTYAAGAGAATPTLVIQRTQVYGDIPPGMGYLIGPTLTFQLANATCQGQEDPVLESLQPPMIAILVFCQVYGHNYRLRISDLTASYSHDAPALFAPFMSIIQLMP